MIPDVRLPELPGDSSAAVVLLSGGLDSATLVALARSTGREIHALSFDYGQRHGVELEAARRVARANAVSDHRIVTLDLRQFGGSALTSDIDVPRDQMGLEGIPITYVPARNSIFLAIAVGFAEVLKAAEIWIGVNAVDFSGYPDCRPEFIEAFQKVIFTGTKTGVEHSRPRIVAPLAELSKQEIIRLGLSLSVDYSGTHSCYDPDESGGACGHCDSCILRRRGFMEAGVPDPTRYAVTVTSPKPAP
ncbi:MAG: 7-cyano-7-deazaguanine synthase QueC [Acidobacteriota bacterium]